MERLTVSGNNKFEIDPHNNRIVCHLIEGLEHNLQYIRRLEEESQVGKTIIFTKISNANLLESHGYQQEGKINGYFQGIDGYIFTKFIDANRGLTSYERENEKTMEIVNKDKKKVYDVQLDKKFELKVASKEDADELTKIYKKVFKYYPSNVHDSAYIQQKIGDDYFFIMIKHGEKIVSVASAMISPEYKSAEITDCATDPDYRGNSLLYPIILEIEKQLKTKGIKTFYSLTRAQSPGMNLTVYRLGYQFQGRLVNNCKIFSGYEDMNIWTKLV